MKYSTFKVMFISASDHSNYIPNQENCFNKVDLNKL